MKKIKNNAPKIKMKNNNNLTMTILVATITGILAIGVFFALKSALATEKYYVVTQDLAAKTQVTESMMKEIITSKGSSPQNAITLAQVKQGTIYTKYPIKTGDVLSESNTGLDLDTTSGIPDDWSITSFNISADNAVGGNIAKGDYFDVIGVDKESGAKYLFFNVLALEVNSTENASGVTAEGKVVTLGEQVQYVVGMPSDKVALFQHALSKYENEGIKLVLSPSSLKYKSRNTSDLVNTFLVSNDLAPTDLYKGTDNTFTPILRDEKGQPVNSENCSAGKISPKSLCANIKTTKNAQDTKNEVTTESVKK